MQNDDGFRSIVCTGGTSMKSPAEQCRFLPEACRVGRMQDRILHCNKDCDYVAIPVRHVRSRCACVSGSQVLPSKSCQTDFDMPLHREGASTTDSNKKKREGKHVLPGASDSWLSQRGGLGIMILQSRQGERIWKCLLQKRQGQDEILSAVHGPELPGEDDDASKLLNRKATSDTYGLGAC